MMTPEEFIAEAKRRGLPKEQVRQKYDSLMASGAFGEAQPAEQPDKETAGFWRRALYGASEPITALAQAAYNAMPYDIQNAGDELDEWLYQKTGGWIGTPAGSFNKDIADTEERYRQQAPEGFDAGRFTGNVATSLALTKGIPNPSSFLPAVAAGGATGAAMGAMTPVYDGGEDFWKKKGKQAAYGGAFGAAATPVARGISRVLLPNAANKMTPQGRKVAALKKEGVKPTVGQSAGGWANTLEEKLQSTPILGDFIIGARKRARDQLNSAAINRALKPIGESTDKIGHEGVEEASRIISRAYTKALDGLKGVKLDSDTMRKITDLRRGIRGLPKAQRRRFDVFYQDNVAHRLSPVKGMEARTFKTIESELGTLSSTLGKSGLEADRALGNAFKELQDLLRAQAAKNSPLYADALRKTNRAFANLARVQDAAKRAALQEGVFTPGQLLMAVRAGDKSARGNATARGKALMQDLATPAQSVLGNKYPDSGTAGRALIDGLAIGTGLYNAAIPASLFAGGALYSKPLQNVMAGAVNARPQFIYPVADMVRQSAPAFALPFVGTLEP